MLAFVLLSFLISLKRKIQTKTMQRYAFNLKVQHYESQKTLHISLKGKVKKNISNSPAKW